MHQMVKQEREKAVAKEAELAAEQAKKAEEDERAKQAAAAASQPTNLLVCCSLPLSARMLACVLFGFACFGLGCF